MTRKRFSKRGGVDTSSTIPYNDLPVNNNNNVDSDDTTSQGSLHLSDLNVTSDSNASGVTTNESNSSYTHGIGTNNLGGKRSRRKSRKSRRKSRKSRRKSRKSRRKSRKSRRKSRKSKRKSRRKSKKGGADEADEDTSPTPMNEKVNDMMQYFK
jgi:hypothetical protein